MTLDQFNFEPSSPLWTINRELVLLLAGARSAILQIAYPEVDARASRAVQEIVAQLKKAKIQVGNTSQPKNELEMGATRTSPNHRNLLVTPIRIDDGRVTHA